MFQYFIYRLDITFQCSFNHAKRYQFYYLHFFLPFSFTFSSSIAFSISSDRVRCSCTVLLTRFNFLAISASFISIKYDKRITSLFLSVSAFNASAKEHLLPPHHNHLHENSFFQFILIDYRKILYFPFR